MWLVDECARGHLVASLVCVEGRLAVSRAMWAHFVVVPHDLEEHGLHLDGVGGGMFRQELLQGAVPTLHLAAGLGVIGRRVLIEHATLEKIALEAGATVATSGVVDRAVVAQHRCRDVVKLAGSSKDPSHVVALDGPKDLTGEDSARVIVNEGQDLDLGAVAEVPVRHVALPTLVGQTRFEAYVGGPGPFARFGGDEPAS